MRPHPRFLEGMPPARDPEVRVCCGGAGSHIRGRPIDQRAHRPGAVVGPFGRALQGAGAFLLLSACLCACLILSCALFPVSAWLQLSCPAEVVRTSPFPRLQATRSPWASNQSSSAQPLQHLHVRCAGWSKVPPIQSHKPVALPGLQLHIRRRPLLPARWIRGRGLSPQPQGQGLLWTCVSGPAGRLAHAPNVEPLRAPTA